MLLVAPALLASAAGAGAHGRDLSPRGLGHDSSIRFECFVTTIELPRQDFCLAKVTDVSNEGSGSPPVAPKGFIDFSSDNPGILTPTSCELEAIGAAESDCLFFYRPTAYGTGVHKVSGRYTGEVDHVPAETSVLIKIERPTETLLRCDPEARVGEATSCAVLVKDTSGETVAPSGIVKFTSNGSGSFSGGGECALSQITPTEASCETPVKYVPSEEGTGDQQLRAEYRGDASHTTSAAVNYVAILPAPSSTGTTTALSCEPEAIAVGHPIECRVAVADVSPGFGPPTGPVALGSDGPGELSAPTCLPEPIGADESACGFEYTPSLVGSGEQQLSAGFEGDDAHNPSAGAKAITVRAEAVRYAAPGGSGAQPCADPAHPCSLFAAADPAAPGSTIGAGDEVVVAAGIYKASAGDLGPGGSIATAADVSVHGEIGAPRPQIDLDGGSSSFTIGPDGSLSFVDLNGAAGGFVLGQGASADAVIAKASGNAAIACAGTEGVIRDSVCLASGAQSVGVGGRLATAATQQNLVLRNVTALASGANSAGLELALSGNGEAAVDAEAVIAEGEGAGSHDVLAKAGVGAIVSVKLNHSAFDSAEATGAGIAAVSAPGEDGNIVAAPQFELDGFHEKTTSPTLNQGATDALSGATDVDGQDRQLGIAADIGADEAGRSTAAGLQCAPAGSALGEPVTCVFTIADTAFGPKGTPTGTVFFSASKPGAFKGDGTCKLAAAPPGASTSCQVEFRPGASGAQTLEALYGGDHAYAPRRSVAGLSVTDPTTTTLACAPASLRVGLASTCTATVEDTAMAGATVPTERVKFSSDSAGAFSEGGGCGLVATGPHEASCSLTYTAEKVGSGSHVITATYAGETAHHGSEATAALKVVAPPSPPASPAPPVATVPTPPSPPLVPIQDPETTILKHPKPKGAPATAIFSFVSDQPGSSFQCKLDKGAFKPCASPFNTKKLKRKRVGGKLRFVFKLKRGVHSFEVRATDAEGLPDLTPAAYRWTVGKQRKK